VANITKHTNFEWRLFFPGFVLSLYDIRVVKYIQREPYVSGQEPE